MKYVFSLLLSCYLIGAVGADVGESYLKIEPASIDRAEFLGKEITIQATFMYMVGGRMEKRGRFYVVDTKGAFYYSGSNILSQLRKVKKGDRLKISGKVFKYSNSESHYVKVTNIEFAEPLTETYQTMFDELKQGKVTEDDFYQLANKVDKRNQSVWGGMISQDLDRLKTNILRASLEVDPNHEGARKALGYERYKNKWMTSEEIVKEKKTEHAVSMRAKKEIVKKKKAEYAASMRARGLIKFEEKWMTPEQKVTIQKTKEIAKITILSEQLISKDRNMRNSALKKMKKLDLEAKKELVSLLIEALKNKGSRARKNIVLALGQIGPVAKKAIPALIIAGENRHISETLKKIGPTANDELVPAFIEALKDKNEWVRSGAARALGKIGPEAKEAVPALIEALKDKDKGVRCGAVGALGKMGPAAAKAVPALIIARSEGMASYAIEALEKIGPTTKEAVPALIAALKYKDQWICQGATMALGEIGPEAKEAIPALIEALKDWDENDRSFAAHALGKIGPAEETAPVNEKLGDIFYKSQKWDNALNFYTEAMRLDPRNLPLKEKTNKCRQIAKLEKERTTKGLVVYKDRLSKAIKVRYKTFGSYLRFRKLSKDKLIEAARSAMVTVLADNKQGSGFLISEDGYLLTNEHVVGRAKFIKAKFLTGKQVSGEVVRINKFKDVALVKLEKDTYPYLSIGDSSKINVGKDVYAVGTPLSEKLSHTVTKGIVSGFRVIDNNRYIQSDVSVHPGNSGGPLIAVGNGVVGICVSGIGFGVITLDLNLFIPIEDAINSVEIDKY